MISLQLLHGHYPNIFPSHRLISDKRSPLGKVHNIVQTNPSHVPLSPFLHTSGSKFLKSTQVSLVNTTQLRWSSSKAAKQVTKISKTKLSKPVPVDGELEESEEAKHLPTHDDNVLIKQTDSEAPPIAAIGETIYEKKTPVEHVLLRPDTYIGGIEPLTNVSCWTLDTSTEGQPRIRLKESCSYVPGLFKIFDEILVNASDNRQRDPKNMTEIKVDIDVENNLISVYNNGRGIPVEIHPTEKVYIPELVLGNLFTGSNFNDSVAKVTGGRNGYGAKLTNIFSTEFSIETLDSKRKLKYTQTWKNNMNDKSKPVIEKLRAKASDYTLVKFRPDLSKFGMKSLKEGDIISLMERRVYDVGACNEKLSVYLNGRKVPNSFDEYLGLYTANEEDQEIPRHISRINERWQVGVGVSLSGQFQQVSFVNSICTSRGGTHVNYIAEQVAKYVLDQVKKKDKEIKFTPNHIKNHLSVFVNCLVENPAFDSQTKETLTTRVSHFGSKCNLSKAFLDRMIESTNLVEYVLNWAKLKQQSELTTKSGKQQRRIVVPKLYDANWAGGPKSNECTLILTEGDSAKALAVAGLSVVGRDTFGVFPLRGKLLNVRDASHTQLMENKEIQYLVTILGLVYGKDYTNPADRDLRYGKVMIMTDQDHDGSHIKGLLLNFVHTFWPALLEQGNFVEEFVTPIVKASKGKQKVEFFTIPEYEQWKESLEEEELSSWHIKYYKGLGTSTAAEAKEYFGNLLKHRIVFKWDAKASSLIEMAFKKTMSSDRKDWLNHFDPSLYVDHTRKELTVSDFVNKELILFSRADNIRSIPSVIDGLKPGQRKVLYACFKKKLKHEMKVAQLAGYVSEHTSYHHGEQSLHATIIHMAQNFVGSNNIPLLVPSGQFGTRLQGGKDAASARYLYTKLSSITRKIFPEVDDELLTYLNDDGQLIQPEHYVPIIPMVLVNGSEGVGTGWSTSVPTYNPEDIIANLLRKLNGEEMKEMIPWSRGFQGIIEKKGDDTFVSRGVVEKQDSGNIIISELPLFTWVDDYKEFLDSLMKSKHGIAKAYIRGYTMQHTKSGSVKFVIKLAKAHANAAEKVGLINKFKLEKSLSTSNMHLFNTRGELQKYSSPLEIIEEFFQVRSEYYKKRRSYLLDKTAKEMDRLSNKARFCTLVAEGKLKVGNRTKKDLLTDLEKLKFAKEESAGESGYDYLLNTPLWNLTFEKIEKLNNEKKIKEKELKTLKKTTSLEMWRDELLALQQDISKIADVSL